MKHYGYYSKGKDCAVEHEVKPVPVERIPSDLILRHQGEVGAVIRVRSLHLLYRDCNRLAGIVF